MTCPDYKAKNPTHYRSPVNGTDVYQITIDLPNVAGYEGFTGAPGAVKVLHDTAKAYYADAASPTPRNAAALETLAAQIAKDYYDGLSEGLDVTYPGVQPWQPEGVNDLTFSLNRDRAQTRVQHKPWNYGVEELLHAVPVPVGCAGSSSSSTSSGSSASSGSGCPCVPCVFSLPNTMSLTVTNVSGCACLEGTFSLVNNGFNDWFDVGDTSCIDFRGGWEFDCRACEFQLRNYRACGCNITVIFPDPNWTCNNITWTADAVVLGPQGGSCCCVGGTVTITLG